MLRNYLKIAYRTLRKRIGPTLINIVGLSVGLAACLLIGLWVEREIGYDDFHPDADRVYRVAVEAKISGDQPRSLAPVPAPLAGALRDVAPEVEAVTRIRPQREFAFTHNNRTITGERAWLADSTFFDVFGGFELLHGSPETALTGTQSVVLPASMAERAFGRTDVVGETITYGDRDLEITGVMADVPGSSHLDIDALLTLDRIPSVFQKNWTGWGFLTYVKLVDGTTSQAFERSLQAVVDDYAMSDVQDRFDMPREQIVYRFFPQPLTDIHLYSNLDAQLGASGAIHQVYAFSIIGLFILLIACINFMNLATARGTERSTEVGMRKALGAGRRQLTGQFFGEAILTAFFAMVAALGLASMFVPVFNDLAGTTFTVGTLFQPVVLLAGLGLTLLVGILAGSYPALVLSRFVPADVLKGSGRTTTGRGSRNLRQGLVVFQFAISIVMIVGTLVAWQQFDYIQTKRLGLDKERVVELKGADQLGDRQDAFVDRVRRIDGVTAAGAGGQVFGSVGGTAFIPADNQSDEAVEQLRYFVVGPDFIETLGIDVHTGRSFQEGRPADSSAVVLNEAAAEAFGWTNADALNKELVSSDERPNWSVIGVTENFHYQSMRQQVAPLALLMQNAVGDAARPSSIFARLSPGRTSDTMERLQSMWTEAAPQAAFQYAFLDQTYDRLHRDVQRAGTLFGALAGLALVIACLGLFGLATYTVQRRSKEIGIRKALGASATQVVLMLSRQFLILVTVAGAVGLPVAYYAMQQWLQNFAYRITPGVGLLTGGLLITTVIAFVAISYQALRAARLDPATTLRDE